MTNELQILQSKGNERSSGIELIHVPCDLCDNSFIDAAADILKQALSNNGGIDLLLNVAGILGDNSEQQPGPERSASAIKRDWLRKTFEVRS